MIKGKLAHQDNVDMISDLWKAVFIDASTILNNSAINDCSQWLPLPL